MTAKILGTLLVATLLISCEIKKTADKNEISSDTIKTADIEENKTAVTESVETEDDFD